MIAVDTNILARFYCDDPQDPEAARQRPIARRIMVESPSLFVPLTVVLEFEWVFRGFYELLPMDFGRAMEHLLGMSHVTVERWEAVHEALAQHGRGLEFPDALHWACSGGCERLVTFDDRVFARRANRLRLSPKVALAV